MAVSVKASLKVKNCYKIRLEVQSSATAGARQRQDSVRCTAGPEHDERLALVTRLGERCTPVPMRVQGSDETKLEVHGSQCQSKFKG